jgi:hypothetical protein
MRHVANRIKEAGEIVRIDDSHDTAPGEELPETREAGILDDVRIR